MSANLRRLEYQASHIIAVPPASASPICGGMQCHFCERPIKPSELIIRQRYTVTPNRTPVGIAGYRRKGYASAIRVFCKRCHIKREKARRYKESEDPFYGLTKRHCANCRREIWSHPQMVGYNPAYDLCSQQCRNKQRTINRRVKPRTVACEVCGKEFHPKRVDAKTCGPTCRQRLRRAQARGAAP